MAKNVKYKIIHNPDVRQMSKVRITIPKYNGIEYVYGNLKFEKVAGEPIVRFVYEVLKNPTEIDLDNDKGFKMLISDILDEVLTKAFAEGQNEADFTF